MPSRHEHLIDIHGSQGYCADFQSQLAVIITHPWGPLGGNMHNNVVVAASLYFQRLQITTVRFDFCGTQIGRGYAQVQQVKDVAQGLLSGTYVTGEQQHVCPQYLLLVGYSYGSLITSSASAEIPECIGFISIAPPFAVQHWLLLFNAQYHLEQAVKRVNLPRLLILGSHDNFTSEAVFRSVLETRYPTDVTTGAVVKGADHFFARREKDVMDVIGQWLRSTFPACQGDLKQLRNLVDYSTVDC